eukprot:SAG22_NODE_1480_length_4326_cov_32.114739_5_plen_78_part_01
MKLADFGGGEGTDEWCRAVDRAGGCVGTGGGLYIPCAAIVELIDVEPRTRAAAAVSRKFHIFEFCHPRWQNYAVPSLN